MKRKAFIFAILISVMCVGGCGAAQVKGSGEEINTPETEVSGSESPAPSDSVLPTDIAKIEADNESPASGESMQPPDNTDAIADISNSPAPLDVSSPPDVVEPEMKPNVYEIRARLHEDMPEYRFVTSGLTSGADEWVYGFVMGLEGYDENGLSILSAGFSIVDDGRLVGNCVYNQMMDTMGLHVVDVNFDGYKDVIILSSFSGAHSNTWYDCWLWDIETSSFVASKSFAEICNPALDAEKECIYSSGGSGAAYWGGRIYKFIDGEFIVTNELYTHWDGLVETRLVAGEMQIVREVSYGEGDGITEIIEREQEYYKNDELWQLDHPHWYWYGGHHADEWLE